MIEESRIFRGGGKVEMIALSKQTMLLLKSIYYTTPQEYVSFFSKITPRCASSYLEENKKFHSIPLSRAFRTEAAVKSKKMLRFFMELCGSAWRRE